MIVFKKTKGYLMAQTSFYLNFNGQTEEAFEFYKTIYNGKYLHEVLRFGDMTPNQNEKNFIMHMQLQLPGGQVLMGSDILESLGQKLTIGNNFYINVELDSKTQADEVFAKLSEAGKVIDPLQDTPFNLYFGTCSDKFGVQWMITTRSKS